jgi:beta-catenin-like protein 1
VQLAHQCLQVIVQNMKRLNETIPEEKVGVYKTLSLIENFLEARREITIEALLKDTDLVPWLLQRLKPKPFDDVKGYANGLNHHLLFKAFFFSSFFSGC